MIKDTGGPAFPGKQKALLIKRQHADIVNEYDIEQNGMTLRDYFAASFVTSGNVFKNLSSGSTTDEVAAQAYALADAMLEARKGGV